jgi:(5-formylfuran-3-yl)methyl phosphate synthase
LTLLLASVASAAEAEIAVENGADMLDLVDEANEAPRGANRDGARDALLALAPRRPTIASLGAPPYTEDGLTARARPLIAAGAAYLKLTVDAGGLEEPGKALKSLASEIALIGVMYADRSPDFDWLTRLRAMGFKGAMLDTADAKSGRLLKHMDVARLDEFCTRCRALGLISILAGSLEPPDAPRLLLAAPDVLGFRGAIDPAAAGLIRDLIPRAEAATAAAQDARREFDRIFVRDFLIEAKLGAYDYERGSAQRVIFTVEAKVRRGGSYADDMRKIFSYDIIMDAIRLVVGRGHVNFVETLAEGVAEIVLRHKRVAQVRVRVEKLDVIAGAVGVEIIRERG